MGGSSYPATHLPSATPRECMASTSISLEEGLFSLCGLPSGTDHVFCSCSGDPFPQVLPKAATEPAAGKKDAKGASKRKDAPGAKGVAKKGKSGVGGGKK